ncbi:MAG: hypothetical protein ABEI86_03600, partial [Halobacteriaceae archaeon]
MDIFNYDWDLLIILDTCRVDAIKEVKQEYEFINDINSHWSVGGSSNEWILNTFNVDNINYVNKTSYVTSNPHAMTVLEKNFEKNFEGEINGTHPLERYSTHEPIDPEEFYTYVPLYKHHLDDQDYTSPRRVTDHVINIDRNDHSPRIVAHYMPPHKPYLARQEDGEMLAGDPRDVTWESYIDNLRWGLNEVQILLNNVDRDRVVITADHGENFLFRPILPGHRLGMMSP